MPNALNKMYQNLNITNLKKKKYLDCIRKTMIYSFNFIQKCAIVYFRRQLKKMSCTTDWTSGLETHPVYCVEGEDLVEKDDKVALSLSLSLSLSLALSVSLSPSFPSFSL